MSINFSDLKRRKIRKKLSDGVVIYNPDKQQKAKIIELMMNNANGNEIVISGEVILVDLIPLLTNIELDLDKEKDKEKIQEILNDPDELLEEVTMEIANIVKGISKNAEKILKDMQSMPKEKVKKLIDDFAKKNDTSDKEKKKMLLLKQLEELNKE